jgi:predicted transcriptional regulator
MTIKEIAGLCGVSDQTVLNWIHKLESLNQKIWLRISEKLEKGSPEHPSDYDLGETLEIISEGGGNKALASLLGENAINKNAVAVRAAHPFSAQKMEELAGLMEQVKKRLEDPRDAAYRELETWIGKTLEVETKPIHRVYIHQLWHAYTKIAQNPLNKHDFMFKIALDHPEFELRHTVKDGWFFAYCTTTHII